MAKRIARIVLEALSALILLGTLLFLIIYWKHIPARVPSHFGITGEVTAWSGKMSLFLYPVLMAVVFVSLFFVKTMRFRSLGGETRIPVPELLFPALKLPLLAGISYLTMCAALVRTPGVWFFPVFLAVIIVPMLVYSVVILPKIKK